MADLYGRVDHFEQKLSFERLIGAFNLVAQNIVNEDILVSHLGMFKKKQASLNGKSTPNKKMRLRS